MDTHTEGPFRLLSFVTVLEGGPTPYCTALISFKSARSYSETAYRSASYHQFEFQLGSEGVKVGQLTNVGSGNPLSSTSPNLHISPPIRSWTVQEP